MFWRLSEDFRPLSEDLRRFSKIDPKARRMSPKISEEVPMMFRSYNTTSEYFLSNYVAIAKAILRLVPTTWYFYT